MVVAASCCGDVFQQQRLGDRIEAKMNGAKYRGIIDENLHKRAQDLISPSKRTTTLSTQTRQCISGFGDKSLNVLECPSRSSDLNPIEHLERPEDSCAASLPIQPDRV